MYAKVWDVLDVVTLVACSEFCLQFDWDFEAFVTEQLRESRRRRTGQEYPFTFKQVKGKLTDLARSDLDPTRQTKEYPRYDEIIAKGSACFPRLARELRPQIDLELERFRELYPLPQPQGAQLPDTEGITSNVRDVLLEENSELPDRRLMEVSSTPRKLSNTTSPDTAQNSMKRNHPHDKSVDSQVPTPKTVVASSKSHNRIEIRKGYSPGNGAWQRSQILDHQHDATGRLEILWEEDVTTLRGQIADLEREKERLLAMLQIFDNAQQQSESSGHDPKVSQLRVYQQDIWTLQQLNIDLESVADFFKLEATESRAFQTEHIDKSMEQIQTELESILGNCDTTNLQVNRALEHGSDLEALLLSCLKLHKTPEHLDSRLKECISQFEVPILVRAVVLAALNDWVFNASFPPFMREGSTSLFLKSIEEIALEHRDWAWLRNLETAAYSRFLERSEFKEGLLPMKSRLLADRLSNATASFITPITSEISRDDKPKAIDSILESLHARYIKLFSAGLKFKAATAVTDNKYEFVLKLPGTLIGEQSQEQIPRSTHTTQERSRIADKERSWFHASLRVYDAGPANWLNPRTDAIIQTDNFVSGISKTNNKCIYHKDIAIKISDIREDRSGLETHRTIGRSGSQLLSALFTVQFNDPDTRPNSYNRIDDALEQKMSRSSQNLTNNPSNREPDQHQAADTSAKQIAAPQRQRDNDNGSQPDLTPVADPYQMDPGVSKTNAGATKSKRGIRRSTIDRPGTAGAFVCSACGTPLSTSDILRRHEKNGSCRRCKICARKFPSNKVLKKHQLSDHSTKKKRQRLSQDGAYSNKEIAEPNDSRVCERCNRKFTPFNLERHLRNKSCSKCYKCGEEFDIADEFYGHMKLSHDLQFVEGHWKRLDIEERTGEPSLSRDLPNCSTSDETGHMLAQGSAISQAPDEPEVNIFAPSNAQNAQRKLSVEATPERSNFKIVESNPQSTPVSSNGEKHHCSNCNETFSTQTALDEHKGRQHQRIRVHENKKGSAIEQPGSPPKHPQAHPAKDAVQDRTLKSRIEKQSRSRASTEMRREPTPPSRHVTRIIGSVAKACELENNPATRVVKSNEHCGTPNDCISQGTEITHTVPKTTGSDCTKKTAENAQILKAQANFGGQFSAPPRTFEKVAAGLGPLMTGQL